MTRPAAYIEPTIVTGHGRSGTHWLAHVLGHFVEAQHEPEDYHTGGDIIVDCRLHQKIDQLRGEGYRVLHLVRDGRDVVRSTYEFYRGGWTFEECCEAWAMVVKECHGLGAVRFEDLVRPIAASNGYRLSHWREWPEDLTHKFWQVCSDGMREHGYGVE